VLFESTQHTEILPLALDEVRHEKPTSRTERIVLQMRAPDHALADLGKRRIRLHFHGEISFTSTLRLWFLRHCTEIAVVIGEKTKARIRESPTPVGLDRDARLLPERPLEHDAFTTLAELFAFPQKFAFVDLPPLGSSLAAKFELHVTFDRPPKLPKNPVKGDIRLHCVPVVNLFKTTSDPVRFKPLHPEAIVRVADQDPVNAEVYDAVKVVGSRTGSRRTYPAFHEFRTSEDDDPRYYRLRRVPSVTDVGTDVYISLMSPRDVLPVSEDEVLSIDLLATNRAAATQLKVGDLKRPVRGAAATTRFSNIEAVSPPLYPHDNVELLWRLSAHLGLSRRGLQDADTLRRVLEVYNFAEHGNPGLGRLNNLWIDAIREVQTRKLVRLFRGAPVTGTRCIVILDETNFAATGEALLFGEVLNEVFARRVAVNSFNALTIQLAPSRREYSWPPRNGNLTL
jgi:type VI secretion system protein ImpG